MTDEERAEAVANLEHLMEGVKLGFVTGGAVVFRTSHGEMFNGQFGEGIEVEVIPPPEEVH